MGFRLGQPGQVRAAGTASTDPVGPESRAEARASRILRAARDAGKSSIILFGLGSKEMARRTAEGLDPGMELVVCATNPAEADALFQAENSPFSAPDAPAQILCDDSDWALFCLLRQSGLTPENSLAAMNAHGAPERERGRLLALKRLFSEAAPLSLPAPTDDGSQILGQTLDFAAILHPDEPDLDAFFRAIPAMVDRIVLVWDAETAPGLDGFPLPPDVPVANLARPLRGDFAAQRNFMLAACRGDWILSLDADERPSRDFLQALPRLLSGGCGGYAFPRLTLYPDASRVKVGYGLWPDMQVRLFRPGAARYRRPVHERLEGLSGPVGLALWAPILHVSNLQKDAAALARKHAVFDAAFGGGLRHRQSAEYPSLPLAFFSRPPERPVWEALTLPETSRGAPG